jgi:hypothetical protein
MTNTNNTLAHVSGSEAERATAGNAAQGETAEIGCKRMESDARIDAAAEGICFEKYGSETGEPSFDRDAALCEIIDLRHGYAVANEPGEYEDQVAGNDAAPGELPPLPEKVTRKVDAGLFFVEVSGFTADQMREYGWACIASNAGAAPAIPEGFALVPLIPNAEMVAVMAEEEWAWEDLLAAAEAITEKQYNEIAAAPSPDTSPVAKGMK